jgi:hypothetical protein
LFVAVGQRSHITRRSAGSNLTITLHVVSNTIITISSCARTRTTSRWLPSHAAHVDTPAQPQRHYAASRLLTHANPLNLIAPRTPAKDTCQAVPSSELSFTPLPQLTAPRLTAFIAHAFPQRDGMWTRRSEAKQSGLESASLDHSHVHHEADAQISVTSPRPVKFRRRGQHTLKTCSGALVLKPGSHVLDTLLYSVLSPRSGLILTKVRE